MQGLWRPWPWGEVEVEVELLEWRPPPLQALDVKLFEVPMAQQRYAFVLDVIRQHGAQTVVDLGCGYGKLLEYLLQQVMPETQSDTHSHSKVSSCAECSSQPGTEANTEVSQGDFGALLRSMID